MTTTTITLPRATVEQALEALEAMQSYAAAERKGLRICDEAITALRTALAQQRLTDVQQEMERSIESLKAALAQQAEPVLQTCNCRWDGEVQVQQCTLHEAHVDAIHEWAERAKAAERKLAQQAEPVEPVGAFLVTGNEFCGAPPAPYATWGDALASMFAAGTIQGLRISALAQQGDPVEPAAWVGDPSTQDYASTVPDPQIEDRLARHGIPMPGDSK